MSRNITPIKHPWSITEEFETADLYGAWDYKNALDYSVYEARTRLNINSIVNNAVLFFGNGTIGKDIVIENKSENDGTGGITLPIPESEIQPISEFINRKGVLENNPHFSINGVIQTDKVHLLDDFAQDMLKNAQYSFIDAQASGSMPHYEMVQDFRVNNGQVSSSAGAFRYVDEFDNLPKQTKMFLRAIEFGERLKNPAFKITMKPEDYAKLEEIYDNVVKLIKPEYYKDWNVKTQQEHNKKVYDMITNAIDTIDVKFADGTSVGTQWTKAENIISEEDKVLAKTIQEVKDTSNKNDQLTFEHVVANEKEIRILHDEKADKEHVYTKDEVNVKYKVLEDGKTNAIDGAVDFDKGYMVKGNNGEIHPIDFYNPELKTKNKGGKGAINELVDRVDANDRIDEIQTAEIKALFGTNITKSDGIVISFHKEEQKITNGATMTTTNFYTKDPSVLYQSTDSKHIIMAGNQDATILIKGSYTTEETAHDAFTISVLIDGQKSEPALMNDKGGVKEFFFEATELLDNIQHTLQFNMNSSQGSYTIANLTLEIALIQQGSGSGGGADWSEVIKTGDKINQDQIDELKKKDITLQENIDKKVSVEPKDKEILFRFNKIKFDEDTNVSPGYIILEDNGINLYDNINGLLVSSQRMSDVGVLYTTHIDYRGNSYLWWNDGSAGYAGSKNSDNNLATQKDIKDAQLMILKLKHSINKTNPTDNELVDELIEIQDRDDTILKKYFDKMLKREEGKKWNKKIKE